MAPLTCERSDYPGDIRLGCIEYPSAVCSTPLPRPPDPRFEMRLVVTNEGAVLTGTDAGIATWEDG